MTEKKISPLFAILNSIQSKQYTWEELPEELVYGYNQFMLNRFLSSYEYLLPLLDELSAKRFSDEQHYKILYNWVKKTKHYFNYDAYKSESEIDQTILQSIKLEYNLTNKEARRYYSILTNEQKNIIKNNWSDYIAYNKNSL